MPGSVALPSPLPSERAEFSGKLLSAAHKQKHVEQDALLLEVTRKTQRPHPLFSSLFRITICNQLSENGVPCTTHAARRSVPA